MKVLPRRSAVTAPLASLSWAAGLAVLAVGSVLLAGVGATAAVLPGSVAAVCLVGAVLLALLAGGAALAGRRLGRSVEALVETATRPDVLGNAPLVPPAVPVRELDDLLTALAALQQRVRVSDELAERHRRNADAASAGMFGLLSGLVAAEEGARGQLSAELHDTVAQSLGVARRLLDELRGGSAGAVPATLPDLVEAAEQVQDAEESLRATMARTRPPALRDGDLAAAVLLLRDDLEYRYGLRVELRWPDVEYPIPLATAVTVYRFFQEALLNVVKHAEVDEAAAALEVDARHVLAVVRDAGVGLPSLPAVAGRGGRHVGLGLLRERARLAGGQLDVVSQPGAGTVLTLRLPRPALPVLPERAAPVVPRQRTESAPGRARTGADSSSSSSVRPERG